MTEKASGSQLSDSGLSVKACILVNPYYFQLKRDGETISSHRVNYRAAVLPRKDSRVNRIGVCTVNRNRWSRKVSYGERENYG